jgi:hypothetical protein
MSSLHGVQVSTPVVGIGFVSAESGEFRLLFVVAGRHTIFFETDGRNLAFDGVIAPARMRDPSISKSLSASVTDVLVVYRCALAAQTLAGSKFSAVIQR